MVKLTTQNLHSCKLNDRVSIVQNFKTVVQSQVKVHSCKVEKLDCEYKTPFHKSGHIIIIIRNTYSCMNIIKQLY